MLEFECFSITNSTRSLRLALSVDSTSSGFILVAQSLEVRKRSSLINFKFFKYYIIYGKVRVFYLLICPLDSFRARLIPSPTSLSLP